MELQITGTPSAIPYIYMTKPLKVGDRVVFPGTPENIKLIADYGIGPDFALEFVDVEHRVIGVAGDGINDTAHTLCLLDNNYYIPLGVTYEVLP